jgi:GH43 family beta-xylosidase
MAQKHIVSRFWARLVFEPLEPRLALSGAGLTAQYFQNSDFTGLAETRIENVSHNWGTGSPAAGVNGDTFSVRWTGQIEPAYSESYTFTALSDEGVRVWVDGQLLIDDWTPHVRRNQQGTIALQAGQRYDIRLDYFEGTGSAQIELSWASAHQPLQVIPATSLYESPQGLLGSYSDSAAHMLTRVDSTIDFNWGANAPSPGLNADGFAVTWSGQIRADYNESYTFSTISDERARLWIGNELVIDNWSPHTSTEMLGTKSLEAGKWYDLRVEYQDDTGLAEMKLQWSSDSQTGAGNFEVIPQASLRATKEAPVTFHNPLGPGADPFVTQYQGNYYMTMTTDGKSVRITRAQSLQNIHDNSPASDSVLAWSAPAGTNYSDQVWAPELHHIGASWYIYVAASDGNNANHHMHVLERDDPDPFGPFYYKAQLAAATDRWAIDGTAFEWQNSLYFVWSGWPGFTDGQQNLYIAEMRNPWTLRGDRVLISTPQYAWEKYGLPINEGPEVLIQDGHLQIIYSASGYWTSQYSLGQLTYNGSGSVLSTSSWTKAPLPVFAATTQVVGVGHASFTKSPDGTEDWIVYHAHANPNVFNEDRVVSIQPFTFFANGSPNFGAPLPTSQPIPVPSGLPDPERVYVSGDYNADGSVNALDYGFWRATFGGSLFPGSAADGSGNNVVDAADYVLWRKRVPGSGMAAVIADGVQSASLVAESQPTAIDAVSILKESIHLPTRQNDVIRRRTEFKPLSRAMPGSYHISSDSEVQPGLNLLDAAFAGTSTFNLDEPRSRELHGVVDAEHADLMVGTETDCISAKRILDPQHKLRGLERWAAMQ